MLDGRTYPRGGFGDQQRQPRTGPVIGRAETLDCDGEPLNRVRVRAAVGVPPEQAIVWQRTVQLTTSDSVVTEPVACTGPARFTGRFRYTDHDNPDQTELPPPYDAWFEARRGSGLPLDDMRWVLVRARVTAGTRPELDAAFIDEVRRSDQLVRVVAHCVGGGFVADRVVRHTTAPGPS